RPASSRCPGSARGPPGTSPCACSAAPTSCSPATWLCGRAPPASGSPPTRVRSRSAERAGRRGAATRGRTCGPERRPLLGRRAAPDRVPGAVRQARPSRSPAPPPTRRRIASALLHAFGEEGGTVPSITVVIPALNDARMLERCLADLAAQLRPADEIVVVD